MTYAVLRDDGSSLRFVSTKSSRKEAEDSANQLNKESNGESEYFIAPWDEPAYSKEWGK